MPLEDILQLAACLMSHLLDHPPVKDPSSPPRKQRSRRRTGGREAVAAAEEAPAVAAGGQGAVLAELAVALDVVCWWGQGGLYA